MSKYTHELFGLALKLKAHEIISSTEHQELIRRIRTKTAPRKEISILVSRGKDSVPKKQLLLQEDDAAPDARDYFLRELMDIYGLSLALFQNRGVKTEFGYRLMDYQLEIFPDDQHYHLYKINP